VTVVDVPIGECRVERRGYRRIDDGEDEDVAGGDGRSICA